LDNEYDLERFGSIFSDIRRYIRDLEDMHIEREEDLKDKRNFYATSMVMFSLLNRVLDLGSETAISHDLGIPSTNRDIFVLLEKDGLISPELGKEMKGLVTFRNLLSHEYHGINESKLFLLTKKVNTIREFADTIKKIIQDH
jgi:uncharacterized protein YutE (UPF0331/DUF86 family)